MSIQNVNRISVLIIDDHPTLRAGIRAILEKAPDIFVVDETDNGEDAETLVNRLRPRIILLDLKMPDFSPVEFEKWVREHYPETVTLVLTAHDRDAYLASMMDAGVAGYLNKEIKEEQLINAIRCAASGENLYDEQQKKRAYDWREEVQRKWDNLSEREKQVLCLLADGASNKDISSKLRISPKTVDKHLEKIYQKLDVASRAQAVLWGIEHMGDFPY